jgi:3-hydroxyisobutyrate dehydrogenase-like beta-hydroxyacid dehydrogenase
MDVTIIGTGNMARGLATRVLAGGHSLTLIGHTAGKADALAAELDVPRRSPRATPRPAFASPRRPAPSLL